jgi:hypothetical protein
MRRLLTAGALAALCSAAGYAWHAWQQDLRADRPMLEVTFAHIDHRAVNCVDCHHNFVDDTGQGLCFDCHKTDPAVTAVIEDQFHDLCRGCHETQQRLGEEAGPVRQCIDCHTADEAP